MGDSLSTVGDTFSTVEVVQYSGGIRSVHWGIASVLWRVFSTLRDNISTVGVPSVLWVIIISILWRLLSTVEIRLEISRIFKRISSKNLFQKLIALRNQIDHIAGLKC